MITIHELRPPWYYIWNQNSTILALSWANNCVIVVFYDDTEIPIAWAVVFCAVVYDALNLIFILSSHSRVTALVYLFEENLISNRCLHLTRSLLRLKYLGCYRQAWCIRLHLGECLRNYKNPFDIFVRRSHWDIFKFLFSTT